jgi:D-serine deaminase-like pyridoxal phosphate-dependent protein
MTETPMTAPEPRWVENFFEFEDVGQSLESLETPVPVVDIDVAVQNLVRWQNHCNQNAISNWPHIKTHKLVPMARLQLALGAKGICVQKLGEAEVMAEAGIRDMLLTFNVVGHKKLERLAALRRRTNIAVVADSQIVLEGLTAAARAAGCDIDVLVECDTGGGRNGAQSPEAAVTLAQLIDQTPGLALAGLMTYPPAFARNTVDAFIAETRDGMSRKGLACHRVSTGGSRDMWDTDGVAHVTEYRAGTYIYYDRSLVAAGACSFAQCAETVLSTVVSTPTSERAIIDAGSKALTSDLLGVAGYGVVQEREMATVYNVNEEHGYLDVSAVREKPRVGDMLRVTMNHVCPVNNLFDKIVFVRGDNVLGAVRVDARGKVQ